MTQAYQPPQDFSRLSSDRSKPLIQRPSPKLLARRAVARQGRRSLQPPTAPVPSWPGMELSPAPLPQAKPVAKPIVQPIVQPIAIKPSQRLTFDWRALLQEARERNRLAARQPKTKLPQAKAPQAKARVQRVGSALTDPIPTPNSRSVRRGQEQRPVIRVNEVGRPASRPSQTLARSPRSGSQQYIQRLNALRNGQLYPQIPRDSFYEQWSQATQQPTYEQWRELLALEARAAGRNRGGETLTVMVGDSLSQWFPSDRLPDQQVWLNQGISGDTTSGILNRLNALDSTQPDTIYLMAGVNDLKRGLNEQQVLRNINQIVSRLKRQHPTAQIIVQSILPTRSEQIPNQRIVKLNPLIQQLAQRHGVNYLDLAQQFRDDDGGLRADLTTDGIHLSPQGYQVWQSALQRMDQRLAQRPTRTIARAQTPE
jgi:lysophospholipase L1-like esterase